MFKTMVTLMRGRANAAAEELADRNALLILDQQMRDAQAGLTRSQRALALAIAEDAAEARQLAAMAERMAGLEVRARAALAAGREELATEAAGAIAELEHDLACTTRARALIATELARLRRAAAEGQRRLAELHRGRRVARVADAVNAARETQPATEQCTLAEAEATLTRLRHRQTVTFEAADAMPPTDIDARMAEAGFGPADRPSAATVLARLRATAA